MSISDEIKKQRENFTKQMENCTSSMQFHKNQLAKLEIQVEQLKGAIYALDKLSVEPESQTEKETEDASSEKES